MRSTMLAAVAVATALVATGAHGADVKSVSRLAFGPDTLAPPSVGGAAGV